LVFFFHAVVATTWLSVTKSLDGQNFGCLSGLWLFFFSSPDGVQEKMSWFLAPLLSSFYLFYFLSDCPVLDTA